MPPQRAKLGSRSNTGATLVPDIAEDDEPEPLTESPTGSRRNSVFEYPLKEEPGPSIPWNKRQPGRRPFGISKGTPVYQAQSAVINDPSDYESKYPEDGCGEEMGYNARVWRTYLDESTKYDAQMIDGWRDTVDVLLVFAGLFSAVVTTFLVQTYQSLQPNYTQTLVYLATEQVALQRAAADGMSASNVPLSPITANTPFTAAGSDRWVNGLWFMSLTFSLSVALFCVLVKQWLQHYVSAISGTVVQQVRIRQFRFMGIKRWHVAGFIGVLLPLLQAALLLYLVGLVIFLWGLDIAMASAILFIAGISYIISVGSNFIPLFYPQCPYKTPLTTSAVKIFQIIYPTYIETLFPSWVARVALKQKQQFDVKSSSSFRFLHPEMDQVEDFADELDAEALLWLRISSSNPTVHTIVLQALSGLRPNFKSRDVFSKDSALIETLQESVRRFFNKSRDLPKSTIKGRAIRPLRDGAAPKLERLGRALLQLTQSEMTLPFTNTRMGITGISHGNLALSDSLVYSGQQEELPEVTALGFISYSKYDAPFKYEVSELHQFLLNTLESRHRLPTFTQIALVSRAMHQIVDGQYDASDLQYTHIGKVLDKVEFGYIYDLPVLARLTRLASVDVKQRYLKAELSIRYLYVAFCSVRMGPEEYVDNVRVLLLRFITLSLHGIAMDTVTSPEHNWQLEVVLGFLERSDKGLKEPPAIATVITDPKDLHTLQGAYQDVCNALQSLIEWNQFHSLSLDIRSKIIYNLWLCFSGPRLDRFLLPHREHFVCADNAIGHLLCYPESKLKEGDSFDRAGWDWRFNTFALHRTWFMSKTKGALALFREHRGIEKTFNSTPMISKNKQLCNNMAKMFCSYVFAVLDRQMKDDTSEADDDDLKYLFQPENLSRICRCFSWFLCQPLHTYGTRKVKYNDSSINGIRSAFRKLVSFRLPAGYEDEKQLWKIPLADLVAMTRWHDIFHYFVRKEPLIGSTPGYHLHFSTILAMIREKGLDSLENESEELRIFEYVGGHDVQTGDIPIRLSHVNDLPIYAPYSIPFIPGPRPTRVQALTGSSDERMIDPSPLQGHEGRFSSWKYTMKTLSPRWFTTCQHRDEIRNDAEDYRIV